MRLVSSTLAIVAGRGAGLTVEHETRIFAPGAIVRMPYFTNWRTTEIRFVKIENKTEAITPISEFLVGLSEPLLWEFSRHAATTP